MAVTDESVLCSFSSSLPASPIYKSYYEGMNEPVTPALKIFDYIR